MFSLSFDTIIAARLNETMKVSRVKTPRKILAAALFIAAAAPLFAAQTPAAPAPERMRAANGKYGYRDAAGALVVPAAYDMAWAFREGRALVLLDGKFGFVDTAGNEVVPPRYAGAAFFHDGLAAVNIGGTYDAASNSVNDGKWGYVDLAGRLAIAVSFESAGDFANGAAAVTLDGGQIRINKSGQRLAPNAPPPGETSAAAAAGGARAAGEPVRKRSRRERSRESAPRDGSSDNFFSGLVGNLVNPKRGTPFLEASFAGYITRKGSDFIGGEIAFGVYLSDNDRLRFSAGLMVDVNSERVPNSGFRYWEDVNGKNYDNYWGDYGNPDNDRGRWREDGKICVTHTFIPLVLSREYVFGGGSPFELRLGPAVGIGVLETSVERRPNLYEYRNTFASETKVTWLAGLNGGITFSSGNHRFTQYISLDGSFYFAGKLTFDLSDTYIPGASQDLGRRSVRLTGGKVALTYGWRF
jgi:hypothetical protein